MAALALDRADELGQMLLDPVGAEAVDEGQPAGFVVGVEDVDKSDQFIGFERRSAFEAHRILDAAAELDMGMIGLAGAVADP